MDIKVIYQDNHAGEVKDYLLDELIRKGRIVAFRRSSGWVTIGRDAVRQGQSDYIGPERRHRGTIATFFG